MNLTATTDLLLQLLHELIFYGLLVFSYLFHVFCFISFCLLIAWMGPLSTSFLSFPSNSRSSDSLSIIHFRLDYLSWKRRSFTTAGTYILYLSFLSFAFLFIESWLRDCTVNTEATILFSRKVQNFWTG